MFQYALLLICSGADPPSLSRLERRKLRGGRNLTPPESASSAAIDNGTHFCTSRDGGSSTLRSRFYSETDPRLSCCHHCATPSDPTCLVALQSVRIEVSMYSQNIRKMIVWVLPGRQVGLPVLLRQTLDNDVGEVPVRGPFLYLVSRLRSCVS